MAEKTINTVIVLRNDSTTAWADYEYKLLAGEVGVGYMDRTDGTKVPIVKIGDGNTTWSALPQAEGVFEKDVILTSAFGKYTIPATGYVNAGGAGMTTSEWLKSCLSAVKEPTITPPSFSLSATAVGTKEIGTKISSLAWTGTYTNGSSEFGSKSEDGKTTYTKANGSNQSVTGYEVTCTLAGTVEQKEDGSVTLDEPYVVAANATDFASVTSKCSWGASNRVPLNNVGETTDGQLAAGSSTKTVKYSVTAYREGFYYGTSTTKVDPSALTSKDIRALSKTGASYAKGAKTVSVPVGAASIILACPKANTGVTDVLNTTVNAGMNDAFGLTTPTVVSVGGADATATSVGDYAADYNVWVYTPAEAYGSTASLTVTLG
jgi:hypothetical protein